MSSGSNPKGEKSVAAQSETEQHNDKTSTGRTLESSTSSPPVTSETGETKNNLQKWKEWAWANPAVLISFAAAIFSFGSCYGSNRSADIAEMALMTVQRAFVSLKTIESIGVRDEQGKVVRWEFFPQWENGGATQTRLMRQHVNKGFAEGELPSNFDFHDAGEEDNRPYFLAAKGGILTGPLLVDPDMLTEVKNRKKRLYFWGWAAYRDVFESSEPHLTEFCNELIIPDGNMVTGEGGRFLYVPCTSYNCTDEDCGDYASVEKKLRGKFNPK